LLNATFEKVHADGGVISMAVLIATGVKATGEREVLGVDVGPGRGPGVLEGLPPQLVSRGLTASGWLLPTRTLASSRRSPRF
jgi:putative transposase